MNEASGKLNHNALILEEAQEDIREAVKSAYFAGKSPRERIIKIIDDAAKEIPIDDLRKSAQKSLWDFANRIYSVYQSLPTPALLLAVIGIANNPKDQKALETIEAQLPQNPEISDRYDTQGRGVPASKFYGDLWYKRIKPTLDTLHKNVALDPNDLTGRNSLRNYAEMETRYQDHLDNVRELKYAGTKIVQCSAHADCSDRCKPWQDQRYYSLDGTYGEIDGHKYIPLEVATDVWYTTKAGKRYKNGLLGFNCRHKLEEYSRIPPQYLSEEEQEKQYGITQTQRKMERLVRQKRAEAQTWKGIDDNLYRKARSSANKLYKEYQKYSADNGRAFYPMRTRI